MMNITVWRHVAVAISRMHLKSGQFKRGYNVVERYTDHQTAHTSIVAGNVYARLLEEAPGHVASARQQYRVVSTEWHTFLGFNAYLGARRHRLQHLSERPVNIRTSAVLEGNRKRPFVEDEPENQGLDMTREQISIELEIQEQASKECTGQKKEYMKRTKRSRYQL
jgi:hypothetical protein